MPLRTVPPRPVPPRTVPPRAVPQRAMPLKHASVFKNCAVAVILSCLVAASPTARPGEADANPGHLRVYVGTYTGGESQGIYLLRLDPASGALRSAGVAAEVLNPSFLAIHPGRRFLYAVGEMSRFAGKKTGAVSALSIDPQTGKLTLLNQQSSRGAGPCHLVVDGTGRHVLVANYGGGSVACLPIRDDGGLGEATSFVQHEGSSVHPTRQKGPHAHSIHLDAANRFAFVADLGLDKMLIYQFDADHGRLLSHRPAHAAVAPGTGPRHFVFHPNGRYAYVIGELASTVTAFAYDAERGALEPLQTIGTLPDGFRRNNTTAEIQMHPSGRFVYGSNRGHDSIVAFAVDEDTGKLRHIGHQSTQGKTPRNFEIDPTGTYLLAANQATNNVVVLRIDTTSGKLKPTGHSASVPSPVCVKMMQPDSPVQPE